MINLWQRIKALYASLIRYLSTDDPEPGKPADGPGTQAGSVGAAPARSAPRRGISPLAMARASLPAESEKTPAELCAQVFKWSKPLPGVVPKEHRTTIQLAMDSSMQDVFDFAITGATFAEGLQFQGYPYLSELCQRPEYRRPVEIIAKEMTRKWIKLQSTGKGKEDKAYKLLKIEAELKRLKVKHLIRKAIEHDGFFGRAQLYVDVGANIDDRDEMRSPLMDSTAKIPKGSLKRFALIEPLWTYPNFYNAHDPLSKTFFAPETWFIMGKEVHASRLLTLVSREVPDILKPSYAFGGLSLTQLIKPYVDNWIRTRQSVSDLLHGFSVFGLATNMSDILDMGAGEQTFHRAALFNKMRDNRGLMLIDKNTEEFFNVSAPLANLDDLQAQAQEQMSSVTGIPLAIMFGKSPKGLNASAEYDIQTFQDAVAGNQESDIDPHLTRIINLVQLSLFGEIDPEITYQWVPLRTLSEAEISNVRKVEADTDVELIDRGVIDPGEARARLASQKDSAYSSLDLNKEIVPPGLGMPEDDDQNLLGEAGGGKPGAANEETAKPDPSPFKRKKVAGDAFSEENVKRAPAGTPEGGQFLPQAPGTATIPPGHVRLYHQTSEENLNSILNSGLDIAHAKGIEGPRAVYASEHGFYGDPETRPTVEFHVPKENWSDPFVLQDVPREAIIAGHLPWHHQARYIENDPDILEQAKSGKFDYLLSSEHEVDDDAAKALRYIKAKYAKK